MNETRDLPHKPHNLPPQPTPFIGRRDEIAEIIDSLADPACRLLTLVGAGGVGKTRLAVQAVSKMQDDFAHGVYFVPLQPVSSSDFLVSAIADALDAPLAGQEEPRRQLLNFLSEKEMLLVLDNFEHLLADEALDLLPAVLETAPAVKLLVTSREVLNLQEEWRYPVHGLDYPPEDDVDDIEAYGTVQLFTQCARRVRLDFSPADERTHVIQICRLTEGMPLALELAASWIDTLECAEIAAEIQRNVDFLATHLYNVPDRHRSMLAVFDQSWEMLSQEERDVFKRLSVFRSGFDREAAEAVAGASLPVLSQLLGKSLLRREAGGRYEIHELLRRYAAGKLAQSPEDVIQTQNAHCTYYADFLHQRLDDVLGNRQLEAVDEITTELDNVRAAWQWAVEHLKVEEIEKSTYPLSAAHQFRSRYLEALHLLETAAQRLSSASSTEQTGRALIQILVDLGWLYVRFGRLQEAEATVARCRELYRRLDIPPVPGQATDPDLAQGVIATIRGDYAAAARLGEAARQASETHDHLLNRQFAYWLLTRTALVRGEYGTAQRHAQQAYAVTQETGDRWFMAYCLNELGNVACALGDYVAAKRHYEASYAIREAFNDPEGMALALVHLGDAAMQQEEYEDARQRYQRSLVIYRDINDRGGLAKVRNGLGQAAVAVEDFRTAREQFSQALEIASDIQFTPVMLSVVIGIGELFFQTGREERGLELLSLAAHHPAGEHETRDRAQRCLDRYEDTVSSEVFAAATQRGQEQDLAEVTATLQAELTQADDAESDVNTTSPTAQPADQPLVEPLTPRELEVLQLMAEGLTNREIAEELVIAVGTVKSYTSHIYGKLDVNNRTEAAARARELGLLS